jgi:hypothetical protein
MRLSPKLEKALLFLSDPARPGWVVADAWAIRSKEVAFRTQSGQRPNSPEKVSVDHLADLLDLRPADVLRQLRACSRPTPEPDLQTRLQLARAERARIQALQQFFRDH